MEGILERSSLLDETLTLLALTSHPYWTVSWASLLDDKVREEHVFDDAFFEDRVHLHSDGIF